MVLTPWGLPQQNTTDWVAYTTESYLPTFHSLGVYSQSFDRYGFSWGLSPLLADTFSVHAHVWHLALFSNINHTGLGSLHLWLHLILMTSLKASFPNLVTLGIGALTYWFWKNKIKSKREINSAYLIGLLGGLGELIFVKYLEQWLA